MHRRPAAPLPAPSFRRVRLPSAAAYTGLSPWTLANPRWRARSGIPTLRVGRVLLFDLDELDTWLEAQRERGVVSPDPSTAVM